MEGAWEEFGVCERIAEEVHERVSLGDRWCSHAVGRMVSVCVRLFESVVRDDGVAGVRVRRSDDDGCCGRRECARSSKYT